MELMTATVDSEVEKCLHSAYGHLSWWRLQRFLSSELFADSRQTDPAGFPRPRKPLEAPSAFIVAARLQVRAYFAVVVAHGAASWAAQFQLVPERASAAWLRVEDRPRRARFVPLEVGPAFCRCPLPRRIAILALTGVVDYCRGAAAGGRG